MRNVTKAAAAGTLVIVAMHQKPVHAYIDPGTASYAFQIVTGAVLGGLFLVKTYWHRLKSSVRNGLSKTSRTKA
jgi:hydrogenase-4 membrane subunit HyfE